MENLQNIKYISLSFKHTVACYFETFEDTASSRSGVQYMLDIGIVGTNELLDNVE